MVYEFPRDRALIPEPWDAQKKTVRFFVKEGRGFCLNDMGTGKTLSALWAADYIMEKKPGTRCLILCPLSTMQDVWESAIFTHFIGRRTACVLHGDAARRKRLLATSKADFFIVNHDGIKVGAHRDKRRRLVLDGFIGDLVSLAGLDIVIVDEASAFAEPSSLRSKVCKKLLEGRPFGWPMTGSPMSQGPMKGWGIGVLMRDDLPGKTFAKDRLMHQKSLHVWEPRAGAEQEVYRMLQPAIRIRMDECVDIPPCVVMQPHACELSATQRGLVKELNTEYFKMLEGGEKISVANDGALRNKALQISAGMVYDDDHRAHWTDPKPRLTLAREMMEEAGGKIIIFAPFTSIVEMLYAWLSRRAAVGKVIGATKPKDRRSIFDAFRSGELEHIVADARCMSHGLTLVEAKTVLWYSPTDSAETYQQANKRIHRPGQTERTRILRIVSNGLEREVYRRLETFQAMEGAFLKLVEEGR